MKRSKLQAFWVMPPPENRPMEMGRPMNLEYDIVPPSNLDPKKLLVRLVSHPPDLMFTRMCKLFNMMQLNLVIFPRNLYLTFTRSIILFSM